MKFKFLVKIIEKVLSIRKSGDDEPRADMYLPKFLLALGVVFIGAGICLMVSFAATVEIWTFILGAGMILLGIAAVMCYKNQKIQIISAEEFEYTTFLGNTYKYRFKDITHIRRNQDSITIFVDDKKVHIESMAYMSSRLFTALNVALSPFLRMSTEDLRQLSEIDLFTAVIGRVGWKVESHGDIKRGIDSLSEKQRVVYTLSALESEVNNGGLCRFFTDSSRFTALYVSLYLEMIGALEHKALYDGFISKHGIDVCDLSSFECETAKEFIGQYEDYPYEEYDDKFYELKPIYEYLVPFIKENIDEF